VACRLAAIVPLRDDVVIPLVVAQPKGGCVRIDTGGGAMDMKKPTIDIGERIAARSTMMSKTSSPSCFKKLDFQ
jgi:hypothetical protein